MNSSSVYPKNTRFVLAMKIMTVLYALAAIQFFFLPEETFYLINIGPKVFKLFEEIPPPSEHFWIVLSASMLAMLSALSYLASKSPETKGYVLVHLLSKSVSVAGYFYCFFKYQPYFAYLIGAVLDLSILLTVFFLYVRRDNAAR